MQHLSAKSDVCLYLQDCKIVLLVLLNLLNHAEMLEWSKQLKWTSDNGFFYEHDEQSNNMHPCLLQFPSNTQVSVFSAQKKKKKLSQHVSQNHYVGVM
jgi:hypothetical protein